MEAAKVAINVRCLEGIAAPHPLRRPEPLGAWFEATREEYYARLLGVTQRGEWEE